MWLMSSVVTACRFSCSVACGILVPQPEIEPMSPELQGRFLTTGPPGKSLLLTYFNKSNICVQVSKCKLHFKNTHRNEHGLMLVWFCLTRKETKCLSPEVRFGGGKCRLFSGITSVLLTGIKANSWGGGPVRRCYNLRKGQKPWSDPLQE